MLHRYKDALVQRVEFINLEKIKREKEKIEENIDRTDTKRYGS